MAKAHELDPLTLRAMAKQMDDVVETIMSTDTTAETSAVAGFAAGMAARYRTAAIEVEQARRYAARQRDERLRAALGMSLSMDERPKALRDPAMTEVGIVARELVTGRRNAGPPACTDRDCGCRGQVHP